MGDFDFQLECDGPAFLADFGECIQYTPYAQATVEIQAIVDRNPAQMIPAFKGSSAYKHEIYIARGGPQGIKSISLGRDTVVMPARRGGKKEPFAVMTIFGPEDPGMWHLGVG